MKDKMTEVHDNGNGRDAKGRNSKKSSTSFGGVLLGLGIGLSIILGRDR